MEIVCVTLELKNSQLKLFSFVLAFIKEREASDKKKNS